MPKFTLSGPAEILRASQKDESFLHHFKNLVADVILNTSGTRTWLNIHKQIEVTCELVYFGLTTLSLRQTLGEEYTGLLQVDSSLKQLPSAFRRSAMILLHCFSPWIINKLIKLLEESLASGTLSTYFRPELTAFCLRHIKVLKFCVNLIQKLHLASFYLHGRFYHIPKRITAINYVLVRPFYKDDASKKSLQTLGFLLISQMAFSSLLGLYNIYWSKNSKRTSSISRKSIEVPPDKQCPLCLYKRECSSVTLCGHIFCWECIHDSLKNSPMCPLCRTPTSSSQVVPLINYDSDQE